MRGGRLRFLPPEYFTRSELDVGGVTRTYWMPVPDDDDADEARAPDRGPHDREPPPLLIALHGLNSSGSRLAWWSGLDTRGPRAGFCCVFPDGLQTVWDDHGCGRLDGADDPAFIARLIEHLAQIGAADPHRVVITGVSSGATFAERLLRSGAVDAKGMALVTGTARVAGREACAVAPPGADVLLIAGTEDPMLPFEGGPSRGALARATQKTVAQVLIDPSGHDSVAPLALVADWVAANRCDPEPVVTGLAPSDEGFAIDRLHWARSSVDRPAVTLYRISGGGHGWPNARQYLPARMLGRIPQGWDATGVVLEFARESVGRDAPTTLMPAEPVPAG